jgi:hypothetical protein
MRHRPAETCARAVAAAIDDEEEAQAALAWISGRVAASVPGRVPSAEGGPGHEEQYWQRRKLNAAIQHLRDIEDYYRTRGGDPEGFNMVRADRARAIYEQISDDYLNGKRNRPTLKQRQALTTEALEAIAVGPCRIFPNPPPTRVDGDVVWPSNCMAHDDTRVKPCDRCRARAVLEAIAG